MNTEARIGTGSKFEVRPAMDNEKIDRNISERCASDNPLPLVSGVPSGPASSEEEARRKHGNEQKDHE
jgi:hypothetical protein